MKKSLWISVLFLSLAGCGPMMMGGGYGGDYPGYGGFGGMDMGFGGMDGGGMEGFGDGGFGGDDDD
ncbi:hypothetical protein [Ferrovum myxofaciens]|jgi:hypothetical protein|uniref:Lipoprotein n=1 Tax=Ferrovum myxofaciens TaxID=416213 RepID=A0A8F3DVU6_9PROT|nr:hypothetical protein [Ferrovum myxofaciens]NDU88573.1 hypothetical protein [Ferrovum sp.]KXW59142.1 hypothetical protein FEMY_03680 [Ferrovum myxofaciens]MBU6995098.1 hypothetical protein [Ferrovum myxofaciens]QKE37302.1 MAG: hypothetical protein HO273_09200 [Ferrovum myxofaciens]QKE41477.1 MAG: hypothetical protein HO274_09235 [Ferrovum myxofaciens]